MYLRGLHSRSPRLISRGYRKNLLSPQSAFSTTARQAVEKDPQDPAARSQKDDHKNGGTKQRPKSGIRPFTVLALCIPLGYAVSWTSQRQDGNTTSTSADGFVKYTLVGKDHVSSTSSIFTLKPATSVMLPTSDARLERAIQSIQFKQPQLQIARNYTLLPAAPDHPSDELRFLIRKELNGEMSGYLHRLPIGSEVELRGPVVDYALPDDVNTVVFLVGGTGIAPAVRVADVLARGEATVHILWASRRREDCLGGKSDNVQPKGWSMSRLLGTSGEESQALEENRIVSSLQDLKLSTSRSKQERTGSPNLAVDYFVDEESTLITPETLRRTLLSDRSHKSGRNIVLVSGPEGFVKYWAGPKQWLQGRDVQGPLGGVLSALDLTGWEVVKL